MAHDVPCKGFLQLPEVSRVQRLYTAFEWQMALLVLQNIRLAQAVRRSAYNFCYLLCDGILDVNGPKHLGYVHC